MTNQDDPILANQGERSMIIKLTNVSIGMEGKPLLINFAHVRSVYPFLRQDKKEVTIIYAGKDEAWEVKETVDQIFSRVK